MIVKTFAKIDERTIGHFYNPLNYGVLVLKDKALQSRVMKLYESVRHKKFELKSDQHVNNGQRQYLFYYHERELNEGLLSILEVYKHVRKPFGTYEYPTELDYGVTEYPKSKEGAKLHVDFSYNVQVVITIVFGHGTFVVANSKDGEVFREYNLEPGDIIFMRAPRNRSSGERELRPVHGMGLVPKKFHTLEIREVDAIRRNQVTNHLSSVPRIQHS